MSDAASIREGDVVVIERTGERGLVIERWHHYDKWLVEMYSAGEPLELHAEEGKKA